MVVAVRAFEVRFREERVGVVRVERRLRRVPRPRVVVGRRVGDVRPFEAFGGGFGGFSSSSSDDASDEPSSDDDEDAAGFGERTVRTEGFGADSAVTSELGADRRGRSDAGGDAPEPERRRTVAETSSTRRASAE